MSDTTVLEVIDMDENESLGYVRLPTTEVAAFKDACLGWDAQACVVTIRESATAADAVRDFFEGPRKAYRARLL